MSTKPTKKKKTQGPSSAKKSTKAASVSEKSEAAASTSTEDKAVKATAVKAEKKTEVKKTEEKKSLFKKSDSAKKQDSKKAVAKKDDKKDGKKPGLIARAKAYLLSVKTEMKRVVWPSKKELINYSVAVCVSLVVVGVIIALLDAVISGGLVLLSGLRG